MCGLMRESGFGALAERQFEPQGHFALSKKV
jgi:hypothetical protein